MPKHGNSCNIVLERGLKVRLGDALIGLYAPIPRGLCISHHVVPALRRDEGRKKGHLCVAANTKLSKRSLIRHLRWRQSPEHLGRHCSKCARHCLPLRQACNHSYPKYPSAFSPTIVASSGTLAASPIANSALCTARSRRHHSTLLQDSFACRSAPMKHTERHCVRVLEVQGKAHGHCLDHPSSGPTWKQLLMYDCLPNMEGAAARCLTQCCNCSHGHIQHSFSPSTAHKCLYRQPPTMTIDTSYLLNACNRPEVVELPV